MTGALRQRGVLLLALLLASCTRQTQLGLVLNVEGGDAVTSFDVLVLEGACPTLEQVTGGTAGTPLRQQRVADGTAPMSFDPLEPGTYALVAVGRGDDCAVGAFGCVQATLGGSSTIEIDLDSVSAGTGSVCGEDMVCEAGVCVPGTPPETCSDDEDCGPPSIFRCVATMCEMRTPTLVTHPAFLAPADTLFDPVLALAYHDDSSDVTHVDVGVLERTTTTPQHAARVHSLPLLDIGNLGSLVANDLNAAADTDDDVSLDIRSDGTELAFTMSAVNNDDALNAVFVGGIIDPGAVDVVPLYSAVAATAIGPDIMVGGLSVLGTRPLFLITRSLEDRVKLGSLPNNDFSEPGRYAEAPGPIPTTLGLRGSGSAGAWMVMEEELDGDLLLWRANTTQRATMTRANGYGRPSIALIAEPTYVVATPHVDGVELYRLSCLGACEVDPAAPFLLDVEGEVEAAAVAEMLDGVFVAIAARPTDGAPELLAAVVDPDVAGVSALGTTPFLRLMTLGDDDEVFDVRGLTIETPSTTYLIVAALVGDGDAPDHVAFAAATFQR